jgi:hypothetical protein
MLDEHSFEVRDDFGACCTPVREPSAAEHGLVLPQTAEQRSYFLHVGKAGKPTVWRSLSNRVEHVAALRKDRRRVGGHYPPANHRAYSTDGIADVWGMVGNAIVISHVVCLFESLRRAQYRLSVVKHFTSTVRCYCVPLLAPGVALVRAKRGLTGLRARTAKRADCMGLCRWIA